MYTYAIDRHSIRRSLSHRLIRPSWYPNVIHIRLIYPNTLSIDRRIHLPSFTHCITSYVSRYLPNS
ncbi:hypothetical protein FA13DRAFT_256821 [Coprinellus micaceus]|uniref:Uncharacterized protein n=1 Tax=Coprinellus micaceus TaxID=71717 RepID=A0A4Y7TEN1_COPMI|nr:hypothetical protein FA13DRAFT_256821 [Coprinellus micaceus]